MWMGPRGYEQWVPAPKTNADFSSIGSREKDQYLNGGAGIRGTKDGHKEYNLSWSSKRREELAPVLDIAKGIYDTGIDSDLVYFIDPTVYDWNVLPDMVASTYKTGLDGVPLTVDFDGYPLYPDLELAPRNAYGYPARLATYTLSKTNSGRAVYIPIPPGKTLWLGVHGSNSGAGVCVTPFVDDSAFTTTFPTPLGVDTDQRVNASWSQSDGYTGVEISVALLSGQSTGSVSIQGMIAQILDDGVQPFPGGFISGEGNSGCEFDSIPTISPYLNGKLWGMSGRLIEVGSWR